jgi:hypothetical protein
MKREFLPIKDYPVYNDAVDHYMSESKVFNSASEQIRRTFWDRSSIASKLYELESSRIPSAEEKVKTIEDSFKDYKRKRIRTGHEEPSTMPEPILTDYYRARAQLTVLRGEAEELHKWLKEYADHDQSIEDSKVLAYGLQGVGRCHGTRASNPNLVDVLKEIDGQKCELSPEGVLYISDSRSCYNLMYVESYRRLCGEWHEQRRKAEEQNYKLLVEQYREQGLPAPRPAVKAPSKVAKSSLPKWPEWAKRYTTEPDEN